jgi:uncharacterized membrane protein
MTKSLVLFLAAALIFTVVFLLVLFMKEGNYGLSDSSTLTFTDITKDLFSATVLAVCTAMGIFSKNLYDLMTRSQADRVGMSFRALLKSVVLSVILAPIVVISFLDQLKEFSSPLFAIVFAYQNGFFFQTIIQQGLKR